MASWKGGIWACRTEASQHLDSALWACGQLTSLSFLSYNLSEAIPWSSEQTWKFSSRFDRWCGIFPTRQGTGIWYFHAEVKSSSEDIKLRNVIGFSLKEQAARGPGLTKDWSPWCSIENPENRWPAIVTSPFIIPFWVITCDIMLGLFFKHLKHS